MTTIILCSVACAIMSYLLGSLSFAIIISKGVYKKDIRTFGSGNAGMTNILRTFGKKAAIATFAGDIGKGVVAVILSKVIFESFTDVLPIYGAYIGTFFAVLGHIFPLYFGFKGGKAVSVGIGTIFAIEPIIALFMIVVFFIAFAFSKMVSLGSICGALAYPILTFLYFYNTGENYIITTICAAIMGALVVFLHRQNISRIINGTEYRFMQKKKENDKK